MKRLTILVLVLATTWTIPVHAQNNTDRVQWATYNFSLALPEGWTTSQTDQYMILGTPEDVSAMNNGETPTGTVTMVEIVELPISGEGKGFIIQENAPFLIKIEEQHFGSVTVLVGEIPPIGKRQGMIMLMAGTYRVTVSGPVDQWENTLPMIDTLIASIQAEPTRRALPDRLTMTVQWHNVRFRAPDNFQIASFGADEDGVLLTPFENRLLIARTVKLQYLYVMLRDFSPIRHLFTFDSLLLSTEVFGNKVENIASGEITTFDVGGFEAASIDFEFYDEWGMGRAVALKTADSLYLITAVAGNEQWESTERDLFEGILATLECLQ